MDFEQAFLRVVIASAVLLYAMYAGLSEPSITRGMWLAIGATSTVVSAGLWMMWWFKRNPARPASMRYFGICADLLPMTIGLWGADESGVPLVGIYLWVTVGNGFRFGPRFLLFAYWLSVVCFTLLLIFVPFWQNHLSIGVGLGLVLATIPLYVLVLLSRLTAQKDAALELSNAKSRFVANVSHELRTPLTGVFAVYDLLRGRRLAPDERELIGSLGSAIATLKSSVDAVLQMSKLEAGAERSDLRPFNLRFFLQQLAMLVRPQATAKKLAWAMEVDPAIPTTLWGDPAHLQHVLGNLVNNALKFTPKGGVTLRALVIPNGVRFEVIDTGIGIPLEKQEMLFERFVQADASATRKYGGTGLGTSIAHDLVHLMRGTIGVTSAPGHGSTFWVELPLHEPDAAEPIRSPAWDERREVLVVGAPSAERDAMIATVTALGLNATPWEPTLTAPPSFDLRRYLAALLTLPAADAAVYVDKVLRDRTGSICPWLVVTSHCSPTRWATLLSSGASGVMPAFLSDAEWRLHLAALVNRMELTAEAVEAPLTTVRNALRILIADDNHSNRVLMARLLTDAGHSVRNAARGDEAYDAMCVGNIDLAILDLNMPEMSGPDATKLFRAGEIGSNERLPIIVLSADATPIARQESIDAGANEYLVKPVTASVLLATIERVLAGSRTRQQGTASPAPLTPLPCDPPVFAVPAPGAAARPGPSTLATVPPKRDGIGPLMLVDPERISALRRIGNNDQNFMRQYADAVFDDLESAIGDLRAAMRTSNLRGARDALHKLDGTSASIGAVALALCAKNMRNYLSTGPDTDAATALAELSTTCALTKSAIAAVLHEVRTINRPQEQ